MSVGTDKEQLLFAAALPITDPGERESFLKTASAGDTGLRLRVTKMLAEKDQSERFFSECVSSFAIAAADAAELPELENKNPIAGEMAGTRVGRYRLLRQLGEGGCGVVYLAEQEEPIRRRVAFKLIKLGMDTKSVIARFDAERQALAMMDHPNIAKVLDGGATESGRPYFVLELVQGVKITTYCDEEKLAAPQRLKLFIQVCQAIQHAHQKGVIHRDIKPSNILVTTHDGVAVPKVIDFGIAKAIEGRIMDDTNFTADGQVVGTPAYMSPEQAEMSGLDVDTRSDIYSLGVLLYELLTGRTPFDQKELVQSGLDEMRRTLREKEPQRPSTMLTSLTNTDLAVAARHRQLEPPKLIKSLKGDLDWIVMKALEKERQRRYETANALAMDVLRYLNNEPVIARPPSQLYRLQKLIQRNKVICACGLVVALTLIAGLEVSTSFFFEERQARMEAEQAQANEMVLQRKAKARETITESGVLLSHGATAEADALVNGISVDLLSPSREASDVFRRLGLWNLYQRNWKQAANRYIGLLQVNQVDKNDRTDQAYDLLLAAPILIEASDIADYDRIRRAALTRLGSTTDQNAAEQLIKTSLLLPADDSILKQLEPLERVVRDGLKSHDPAVNDRSLLSAWRTFALSLLEYRRGDFNAAVSELQVCSSYPAQSPACVASTHLLLSMALRQLGKVKDADLELDQGRAMVENRFKKKLESGDDKTGKIEGWIVTPILLHEAESLSNTAAWLRSDGAE
ncbi:MAG TPA: serine/threonine-protein kinase [Verrucomicrobiae bacterium]|nr:serine/threonine-protein kinase [Verrucomicrobiae bacterium]